MAGRWKNSSLNATMKVVSVFIIAATPSNCSCRVPTLLIPDPMFQNVVAIVSGGASGLGAATASYLVRHGARVVVADLPRAYDTFLKLDEETAAGLGSIGGGGGASIKFASTDVTKEDDVKKALNVAEELFGEQGMPNALHLYLYFFNLA